MNLRGLVEVWCSVVRDETLSCVCFNQQSYELYKKVVCLSRSLCSYAGAIVS